MLPPLRGRVRDHLRRRPTHIGSLRRRRSRSSSSGNGGGAGGLIVIADLRIGPLGAFRGGGSVAVSAREGRRSPPMESFSSGSDRIRGVQRPNPSQLRVERCSERSSGRGEQDQLAGLLLVGEDRGEVTVGEPAGARRTSAARAGPPRCRAALPDRPPLPSCAASAGCPAAAALISHALGALADLKERLLLGAAGARPALERAGRPRRVVLITDARAAGCGQPVAGDLPGPLVRVDVHDDELLAVGAGPDTLVNSSCGTE